MLGHLAGRRVIFSGIHAFQFQLPHRLGISEVLAARPVQAALSSAVGFAVRAALPLLAVILSPQRILIPVVAGASLLFLAMLGAWAAAAGGANVIAGAPRVTFWGALAMAVTAGAGALFGAAP